jgi:hypothetical protein
MTSPISGASNWLADAWVSIQNSDRAGGLAGALDGAAKSDGSIKYFLDSSSQAGDTLALIAQNNASAAATLAAQIGAQRIQDELTAKLSEAATTSAPPPPKPLLDPIIFFENGSSLDTQSNVLTRSDGTQINVTTGAEVIDPGSIITMANGAYLNTKTNILTLPDGTRIDTVTGLTVSTSA